MSAADLPPAPRLPSRGAAAPRRGARERTLTRDRIAAAALAIVDAEGLDAMTMRRVAEALGTGAASLYAHVSGKEELIELVIDRVIGETELPEPAPDEFWGDQIKAGVRAIRAAFSAHRDLARASFARIPFGENAMRGADWMIGIMRRAQLPDTVIAYAVDLLALYATAIAYEDSQYANEQLSPEQFDAYAQDLRRYFEALPPDRFPHVAALAGPLTGGTGEERFEFGLEVLIRGLAAMADWSG